MGNDILDILNKIDNNSSSHPNDKILLIDGLNIFIRAFSVNGTVNDKGVPVGGLVGFLKSLSLLIRKVNPTRVIISFDGKGGSKKRKKLLPNYKDNRKASKRITRWDQFQSYEDENYAMAMQLARLIDYLENLPVTLITVDHIEADDVIAYLSTTLLTDSEIVIASGDQDFIQLVNDRVTVWSTNRKKFYTPDVVLEDYNIPSYNFLVYRAIIGDKSDNIVGVKGLGDKKINKVLPDLRKKPLTLDEIIEYSSQQETNMHKRICESKDNLYLNHRLMDLSNLEISGNSKMSISEQLNEKIYLLSKNDFISLYNNDFLGEVLGNPEHWLSSNFLKLNTLVKKL